MFESLEQRRLLAVAVNVSAGVLTINGDKRDNVINVIENAGSVHVETSTLPDGTITEQDFTGITAIKINGGDGDDVIFYDGDTVGATIHGDNASTMGGGNSLLSQLMNLFNRNGGSSGGSGRCGHGGSSGGSGQGGGKNDKNNKGNGNDQITVTDDGSAASAVYGDAGNDVLNILVGNNTSVYGGAGADQIFLNQGLDPLDVLHGNTFTDAGDGNDVITTYGGSNTILGGKGKDTLIDLGGTNSYSSIETVVV